ncbi:MAG TPA: ABC transporter ATP-binding protein [Anaerolineae bacterium]|nr:ABC transporter ATP-binding protein [Anaerolineae bacterium]
MEGAASTVLTIRDLRKSYGKVQALCGVSLDVRRGEVLGLLGPNGAGKTTALECVEGLRSPDGGTIDVAGVDPTRAPRGLYGLVGVQLQASALPPTMLPAEAMAFFCAYHGVAPRGDLLERLGLDGSRGQYRELSTGQQRRLALALAVAHRPRLLLLDEPTAGLDVESRAELHEMVPELREAGTAILLATHDMAEAEKVAGRIAILLRGRIVFTGTPRELTATGGGLTKVSVRTERSLLAGSGTLFPSVSQAAHREEYAVYYSSDPGPTVSAILDYLEAQGDRLIDLRVERPSLEDRFLEIARGGGIA